MAAVVSKVIYEADRPTRRRIAKELAQRKLVVDALRERAAAVRLKGEPDWKPWSRRYREGKTESTAALIESAIPSVPIRLLACAHCKRPVPACVCVDATGAALEWGVA